MRRDLLRGLTQRGECICEFEEHQHVLRVPSSRDDSHSLLISLLAAGELDAAKGRSGYYAADEEAAQHKEDTVENDRRWK